MKRIRVWPILLTFSLWAGCSPAEKGTQRAEGNGKMPETGSATPTPNQHPRPYSTDLSALRSQFNRDKGKVRLVTLLSPT